MKKSIKILAIILSGMLVFSLFACTQKNEKVPDIDPIPNRPYQTIVSEYDQGGLYDGITLSAEFYLNEKLIYPYSVKVKATVDAALAYAIEGATYNFCFSETGVSADGEEKTVVQNTAGGKFDDAPVAITFPFNFEEEPYMHGVAGISCTRTLYMKDDSPEEMDGIRFSRDKGTIVLEFNLDAGLRKYSHDLIFDYNIEDGKPIVKEINRMSDYNVDGQLKAGKETYENEDTANGMPMAMFDSRFQRIAYYAQEMNAGKGYYTNWLEFGTSDPESRTYIALSVSSFSGYFDSASPLTDLYIGFGAFGARSRAFMRSHEKYASLVIVSQETDENWNVISETNRTALEFSTADKRNCGTGFTGHGMRMHEQRNVVTEADFTGDMGCLLFKLEPEDVEGWDAIRECRVSGEIIMRYKKINGKIYIGGRNETFDTIA